MSLPRTYRTYFDPHCSEYSWVKPEQKLKELASALAEGLDIYACCREILNNHSYISESVVHLGVCNLLAELWGGSYTGVSLLNRKNSLKTDIILLTEDLIKKFYEADSRERLDRTNGWVDAAKQADWYHFYKLGTFVAFPGDAQLIRDYNLKAEGRNKGFVSYIVPEPWYGCPTTANLIVLGGAPLYDDFISRIANEMFENPRYVEEVSLRVFENWWMLKRGPFYDETYAIHGFEPEIRPLDLYNSPTYRHWLDQFRRWASWFDVEEQVVMNNVAVVNATAYPTVGDHPLAAGLLPSHLFLRKLIRFIFEDNSYALFVLPSEKLAPVWKEILGEVYPLLVSSGRVIILSRDNQKMNLSPRHLSESEKDRIKSRISEK